MKFCLNSSLWILKQKREKKCQNSLQEDILVCNEPFSAIYQQSLLIREAPVDWKLANGMSIYKEGQKEDLGKYRPVSLTLVPRICHGADLECHHGAHAEQPEYQAQFHRENCCPPLLQATQRSIGVTISGGI